MLMVRGGLMMVEEDAHLEGGSEVTLYTQGVPNDSVVWLTRPPAVPD